MKNIRTLLLTALPLLVVPAFAEEKGAAGLDMVAIRDAMQLFYLDYNQLTTIENLDDILATEGNPFYQGINNNGGALVIDVDDSRLRRRFLTVGPGIIGPPYLTVNGPLEGADGDYDQGTPLDPWGNPYYLYSPLGLVEPRGESISQRFYGDAFHFYSIVSHGPDGLQGGGDDLIVQLPFFINRPVLSTAILTQSATKSTSGYELTIRGYVLGGETGPAAVLINGVPATTSAVSWSPEQIVATLPSFPGEGVTVSVRTSDGTETPSVPLLYGFPLLEASGWEFYQ